MKYFLSICSVVLAVLSTSAQDFLDDFNLPSLTNGWTAAQKNNSDTGYSLTSRAGFLRLRGTTVTLDDTEVGAAFIHRKQAQADFEIKTRVEFDPKDQNETAGIAVFRNERNHYEFALRKTAAGRELFLRCALGSVRTITASVPVPAGALILRVRGLPKYYRFSYSTDGTKFTDVGGAETRFLEAADGLKDVSVGLFASGNGIQSDSNADFDWFEYDADPKAPYADLVTTDPSLPKGYTIFSVDSAEKGIIEKYPFITRPDGTVPENIEHKKAVVYAKYGDRAMHMDVFKPRGKKKMPTVLLVHGGAWITGHYTMENPLAIALAKLGYLAVTVEHRLSNEKKYPAQIHDLKAAVRYLRANAKDLNIDQKRIAVVGGSSGGHLAALLGVTNGIAKFEGDGGNAGYSSAVQSVVDIDGTATFVDLGNIAKEIKGPWNTNTTLTGFSYAENPAIWEEASPITHVNKRSAPTLFLNSSSYRPFQQREEMCAKLNALGINSEIKVVPDTPHPFWLFRPWFDTTVRHIDDFLKRTMK